MKTVTATEQELAVAFTEWDRRYRKDPKRFQNEDKRLLRGTPETYGEACASYLIKILEENKKCDAPFSVTYNNCGITY